uniref:Secreted protein n=1 Tax=Cuerna arida TaxID=1464854 RepID=A0A1B6G0L9_9HEMI
MVSIKTAILLVFSILIQAHGLPAASEESSAKEELKDQVDSLLSTIKDAQLQAFLTHYIDSHKSVEQFMFNVKMMADTLQECNHNTKQELFKQAALQFGDFVACINATVDIADLEQFLLHFYEFALSIESEAVIFVETVVSCRNQTNIFNALKCVVSAIQDQGPAFDILLTNATSLINELEIDSEDLIQNIEKCFGFKQSELALKVADFLIKNC